MDSASSTLKRLRQSLVGIDPSLTPALPGLGREVGFDPAGQPVAAALLERGYVVGGGHDSWQRVLVMTSPSAGDSPIDVSTLRPPSTAHALAPLLVRRRGGLLVELTDGTTTVPLLTTGFEPRIIAARVGSAFRSSSSRLAPRHFRELKR